MTTAERVQLSNALTWANEKLSYELDEFPNGPEAQIYRTILDALIFYAENKP